MNPQSPQSPIINKSAFRTHQSSMSILPGSTIGVLGGGQLGRMFAMAARRLGYRVHTLAPEHDTPTGQIADVEVVASYDDVDAVRAFARRVDVVTFEFENVSAEAAAAAESARDRPAERPCPARSRSIGFARRRFWRTTAFRSTPFAPVRSEADLAAALEAVGTPAVLKTAAFGLRRQGSGADCTRAISWPERGRRSAAASAVLEAFLDLDREISVIGARGVDGAWSHFGADRERASPSHPRSSRSSPADVPAAIAAQAVDVTRRVLEALEYVGLAMHRVLCHTRRPPAGQRAGASSAQLGSPDVRRLPHQPVRAAAARHLRPAARVDRACSSPPPWPTCWVTYGNRASQTGWPPCAFPDVKLHLYGKLNPRPGRKMGHITALAATREAAASLVVRARRRSRNGPEIAISGDMVRGLFRSALVVLTAAPLLVTASAAGPAKSSSSPGVPIVQRYLSSPDPDPTEFRVMRHVDAKSEHFGQSAWMDVWTEFDRNGFRYKIIGEDGSDYIRSKVFRASLETERKMWADGSPARSALTSANYEFEEAGVQADGLASVTLKPRRKGDLLVDGTIFVNPDDGDLVRLEGGW